jgi:hypothetical protein
MALFFEIAVLVLLLAVLLELHAMRSELGRLPLLLRRAEEKKDSPTINVNVGTLPAQASKEGTAIDAEVEAGSLKPPEDEEAEAVPVEEAAPEPEPERRSFAVNTTTSGLVAVKCPSCQAENSSYRSECFNCGASLR